MSNHSSAYAPAESMPASSVRKPARGFFRSFFDAWVKAYGQNRVDANGNVMIGL